MTGCCPFLKRRRLVHNGIWLWTSSRHFVRVRVHEAPLCRLDTGAGTTGIYEPFYRRSPHVDRYYSATCLSSDGQRRRHPGDGGPRPASIRLSPGDTVKTLDSVPVLPHSIVANASENYLDCNIGRDVLGAFPRYVLNFRDMASFSDSLMPFRTTGQHCSCHAPLQLTVAADG